MKKMSENEKNTGEPERLQVYKYVAESWDSRKALYYTYPEKTERIVKHLEREVNSSVYIYDVFPGLLKHDVDLAEPIWITTKIKTTMYIPAGLKVTIHDLGTILYDIDELVSDP